MGSEWKVRLLGDLCTEITVGFVGSMTQEYVESGVPFLRSKNIAEYNVDWNDMKFVSNEFHQKLSKSSLKAGDVAIVRTGKPGTTCVIPESIKEANCSDIVIARANKEILNPHYLAYFMNAMAHGQVNAHVVGAVQQHFNVGSAKKIEIPLPALEQQNKIVDVLKALDDKHRVNNQINQTLEQMAQTLFKSWFVDFDPVIDNALDAGSDIPEVFEVRVERRKAVRESTGFKPLPDDVRRLFPSEFEESELGWVPKGWKRESVSDVIQINPRVKLPKGTEAPFVEMKALPTSGYAVEEVSSKAFTGGAKFEQHDVLLARITPCLQNGKTGFVDFLNEGEVGFGSTEFIVMRQTEDVHFGYVACLARNEKFRVHAMQSMVGSSGRQRVQNSCFDSFVITLPTKDVMSMFAKMSENYFSKMRTNKLESDNLENLRDTLLPKLISGELRLDSPEVEQAKALVE
ncbi:restriction endonuclease subunit S [Vibrio sp. SSH13-20]|uniref:restriction endonuclease subunit S n=1 Tax=Vibrio sp. SSH13-20 TaxID=3136668 RepID=UPI0032C3F7C3